MRGNQFLKIWNKTISFNIEIKNKLTIIEGDSAKGKTKLINMISTYLEDGKSSGLHVCASADFEVWTNKDWRKGTSSGDIYNLKNTLIFIDENKKFVLSEEFASYVNSSTNYFILVSRKPLKELSYSYKDIYTMDTIKGEHKLLPVYDQDDIFDFSISSIKSVITEDQKSGFIFFSELGTLKCEPTYGKSNLENKIRNFNVEDSCLIIADGATIGCHIEKLYELVKKMNFMLFLPLSFEWLLLNSNIFYNLDPTEILNNLNGIYDSSEIVSLETAATKLLCDICTHNISDYDLNPQDIMYPKINYSKSKVHPFFISKKEMILKSLPLKVRKVFLKECDKTFESHVVEQINLNETSLFLGEKN